MGLEKIHTFRTQNIEKRNAYLWSGIGICDQNFILFSLHIQRGSRGFTFHSSKC